MFVPVGCVSISIGLLLWRGTYVGHDMLLEICVCIFPSCTVLDDFVCARCS
jgi:hypothetical protein